MNDMERKTFCAALNRYGAQAQIINGRAELIPFPEIYPDLKKIKYGR